MSFDLDDAGFPILLSPDSDRAPRVDELADPSITVRSGNPHRQVGGRFGSADKNDNGKGKGKDNGALPKAASSLGERHRREDAVRDAAREFETFETQDVIDWLRGRITRPLSQAEVAAFEADVRAQQLADISDILDQMTLGESRGRRRVKIKAPRGYIRKTLGALSDDELHQLEDRLRSRGWSDKQLKEGLHARLGHERRAVLTGKASSDGDA